MPYQNHTAPISFFPLMISKIQNIFFRPDLYHFISIVLQVGLGDPNSAVFRLPDESNQKNYGQFTGDSIFRETEVSNHCGLSEEDMIKLLRLLKKYVNTECVTVVDVASRALQVR